MLNPLTNGWQPHTHRDEYFGGQPFAFTHQTEQQVFCTNVIVVKSLRLFLRQLENCAGALGESIKSIWHMYLTSSLMLQMSNLLVYTDLGGQNVPAIHCAPTKSST